MSLKDWKKVSEGPAFEVYKNSKKRRLLRVNQGGVSVYTLDHIFVFGRVRLNYHTSLKYAKQYMRTH